MSISDAQYQLWLESPGKLRCALFELTFAGNNGGALGEFVARVSNMPYVTGASDTPANKIFAACVVGIPEFTERMSEQLSGRSTQSYGDLIIANNRSLNANGDAIAAGPRAAWLRMNWDGRRVRQWLGDPGWPIADFRLVLDGIISDVFDAGGGKIGFHISDKSALLDRPVMTTLLGGDGPEAGNLMPLALGAVLQNIAPKFTDTINHKYRISAVDSGGLVEKLLIRSASAITVNPTDVREGGVSMTGAQRTLASSNAGTDLLHIVGHGFVEHTRICFPYSAFSTAPPAPLVESSAMPSFQTYYWVISSGLTADDFKVSATRGGAAIDITGAQTSTPLVNNYGWTALPDEGGFQLAGNPVGLITCSPYGLGTGGTPTNQNTSWTAGEIVNQVLTSGITNTPLTSSDIDATSLAAFVALCQQELGIWLTEQITFSDLIDQLVLSVGGWWGFNAAGKMVFGRLDLPVAGTPVYSFNAGDVALRGMKILKRILPRAQVKISQVSNWTQQPSVAGSVSEYNRAFYASGPRVETAGSATVTTWDTNPANHRNAVRPEAFKTFLNSAGQAEANRLATMFQYPTGIIGLDTHQAVYLLKRGDLIYVDHADFAGYGIATAVERKVKGKSHIEFFAQLPDVYPSEDIA